MFIFLLIFVETQADAVHEVYVDAITCMGLIRERAEYP